MRGIAVSLFHGDLRIIVFNDFINNQPGNNLIDVYATSSEFFNKLGIGEGPIRDENRRHRMAENSRVIVYPVVAESLFSVPGESVFIDQFIITELKADYFPTLYVMPHS